GLVLDGRHALGRLEHLLTGQLGRRQPVETGQEAEVVEPELRAAELHGAVPRAAVDTHPDVAAGDLGAHDGVAQFGYERVEHALAHLVGGRSLLGCRRVGGDVGQRACPTFSLGRTRGAATGVTAASRVPPTTMGSPFQRSLMSSFWMRSCNSTTPSSRASGRGGQPGTYTSTGMSWSTPLVTE